MLCITCLLRYARRVEGVSKSIDIVRILTGSLEFSLYRFWGRHIEELKISPFSNKDTIWNTNDALMQLYGMHCWPWRITNSLPMSLDFRQNYNLAPFRVVEYFNDYKLLFLDMLHF